MGLYAQPVPAVDIAETQVLDRTNIDIKAAARRVRRVTDYSSLLIRYVTARPLPPTKSRCSRLRARRAEICSYT